jgi:hypothetical protein
MANQKNTLSLVKPYGSFQTKQRFSGESNGALLIIDIGSEKRYIYT